MRISARQRQLERLAWAGGFFDGEGSTFAKGDSTRPQYRQLNVVVPQAGGLIVPAVLTRFAQALPGLGSIGRPAGGIFQWRAMDHTRSRATITVLHPWVGTVKRDQASAAVAAVDRQYAIGAYRSRPSRYVAAIELTGYARRTAATDAKRLDRAWAAGFLDAEGCFGLVGGPSRVGGPRWYRIRASASQHGDAGRPPAVLRRLHRIVGIGRIERHGEPDDFKWVAEGLPALEHVLTVVGPWLGAVKREQARDAMAAFTSQVRLKGGVDHCRQGHRYDRRVVTSAGRTRAYCNTCKRLRERRERARAGIAPRPFTDRARRYTE